ncbi:hypothetical protein [Nitrosomonas supralitoralis]|uniref:hypothetical protein n=1 Tax=Nitrosomonas supralitoralis TaxID=2116706 RepID=UPI0018D5A396|nr:hypothetical protein [Nitrosomonas supralitoralis]
MLRGLIDQIVLTPKASGTEYACDLLDDLAGILIVAAGKQQKISDNDPLLQQVKMMTETGDQNLGWQDKSCTDENSEGGFLDKSEMVNLNAHSFRKAEFSGNPHETAIHSKDKLVAGAGFEPTTFGL